MRKFLVAMAALWLAAAPAQAGEGMWLPLLLKQQEARMKALGLMIPVDELFSPVAASLKDAVVLFGGGCTGEVVSEKGLVLTNHHCGYGSILSHSTVDNDYITRGYWAMTASEELACPGLSVTFVVSMADVTDSVLFGLPAEASDAERALYIKNRSLALEEAAVTGTHYDALVKPFYDGNRFFLFVTEKFTDIRLVGAPPSSIGNFGGDADNWMWPRHTGDFSFFRIYAGPDNKPADYSTDNVPYRPRRHFPVSLKGIDEGDFTMVYGFPGRTQQYLSASAVELIEEKIDPARIAIREERLRIIGEGMKLSDTVRLKYTGKQKGISNAYKKWQGELLGLRRLKTVDRKRKYESAFPGLMAAAGRPDLAGVVAQLDSAYRQAAGVLLAQTYYQEAVAGIELLALARSFRPLAEMHRDSTGTLSWSEALDAARKTVTGFYKNHDPRIDRKVLAAMLEIYDKDAGTRFIPEPLKKVRMNHKGDFVTYADDLYANSVFANEKTLASLLNDFSARAQKKLRGDAAYALAVALENVYADSIRPGLLRSFADIRELERRYLEGQLLQGGSDMYADANSTLRLSFGQVQGYGARDAVTYRYYTTLDGVMEKEDPDDEEFIVDEKLKALYHAKDFGPYGVNQTMPVAFVASNHTTGGNSGSPVLNANGQLIGINFDRVWEGTMSDLEFDPEKCRNISVDIRYVLFVTDKVAGCGRLVEEMTLVR